MWELLFSRILDFIVTDLWANIDFWRIIAILLFFVVICVYTFRRPILSFLNRERSRSHDKDIFVRSNQIMNERELLNFLERLGTHRYLLKESKKTHEYVCFFEEVGNQYIDKKLKKSCNEFVNKLDRLNIFTAQYFFVYPESQEVDDNCQMALYPEVLHGPPKTEGYKHAKECEQELYSILDSIKELYNSYRQLVKEKINL